MVAEVAHARPLPDWLARRADLGPDRPAVILGSPRDGGTVWTFADLDRRASATARRLAALGIRHGERVALLLRNGPAFVELVQASSRLGDVLVPLNTRLAAPELAWQVEDVDARLLVYDAQGAHVAAALGRAVPSLRTVDEAEVCSPRHPPVPPSPRPPVPERRAIDLEAVHSVIYTSGTTGRPKGALLTYGNYWWSALGSALNLGLHTDDRWLVALPLFHVGGLSILMRSVIYGIPAVVHESFDPAAVNRAIDEDGITIVSVVSAMLRRILDARGSSPYPPWLRCVLLGGGPAPRPLLEECAGRAVPVVQTYGLTETASQVATLAPADAPRKLGSAGKPLLPAELRIVGPDGTPASPGEAGEIVVRGPMVTPGYINRPEETARAIRDGWLHTGDLGYLDDQGYLYVLDRRDDLIISGGENVYPAEVEATLLAHPAVEDAAVVGVPDARWGQVPVAAVKARGGSRLEGAALIAHCAERLARYKVPTRVQFVDALPRTAAGKLRRALVRESFTGV